MNIPIIQIPSAECHAEYYPEVTPNRKFYAPTVSKVIGSRVSPTGNHFAQVSGDSCVSIAKKRRMLLVNQ